MSRLLSLLALAAVALLLAAQPGHAIEGPPTTYTDLLGDAGHAADVASVSVSADADGVYYLVDTTFATPFTDNTRYTIYFDTDRNFKTGSSGGAEVRLKVFAGSFAWDEWRHGWMPKAVGSLVRTLSPDKKQLNLSVLRSDLNGARAFDFYAISFQLPNGDEDDVPSYPLEWHYPARGMPSLTSGGSIAGAPRAGVNWGVGIVPVRSDTGEVVQQGGAIACHATTGTRAIPAAGHGFVPVTEGTYAGQSFAICMFKVPQGLKGKRLRATISVTYLGSTLTKTFTKTSA